MLSRRDARFTKLGAGFMLLTHSIRRWLLLVLVIAACFWGMPAAQRTFVFAQETGVTATDSGSADEPLDLSIREWIERYEEISKAKDAFVANDVAGALERLKAAAASHAELPPGEVMLADLFFLANNPTGAIASLDQAVRQYPEDPEPYLVLGNFAFAQNRNTEAKLLFQQANRLFKSYQGDATRKRRIGVRLYAGLASIAERAEEYGEALPYLNSWVQLDPKNATPRVRLAQTLFRADKGREAYAEAQKAVQLNDKLPAASFLIAQFYTQKGDLDLRANGWLLPKRSTPKIS